MRRVIVILLIVGALAAPVRAQLVVHDPSNYAQAVLIAERTLKEFQTLWAQYETILRMARGLRNMDKFRMPSIATVAHDLDRWEYGRPWLQALNSGDPAGAGYWATARRIERPAGSLHQLPPAARKAIEQAYATIEITDSVAFMGGHQVALVRNYSGQTQRAITELERDVLNSESRYHEMTAILDKVAAGELIGRRQDMATNQLLSHALEQLLARSKRQRDTEAATMNMRLIGMLNGRMAGASVIQGAASDLRRWRQP